jgi:hypothetical protein
MSSSGAPWGDFTHDPRRSESMPLRASDRDRDVVLRVLGEAYADGRLDRQEYDDRAAAVSAAKTLGELRPIMADLVPSTAARPGQDLALASPEDLRALAVEEYGRVRRNAISGVVVPAAILTGIWAISGFGFYWPVFVIFFCVANVLRVFTNRTDIIAEQVKKLERKQRRAIEGPDQPHGEDGSEPE